MEEIMSTLGKMLFDVMGKPEPQWKKRLAEEERIDKQWYAKLRRLCKKHNVSYTRDQNYWDFTDPIGTIGYDDGVECYKTAYLHVKEILEDK